MIHKCIAVVFAVFIGIACVTYPLGWMVPAAGLTGLACLLWVYPKLWMFVVLALLPVGDLSPVTGHLFFNEFDMVVMTVCVVLYLKPHAPRNYPALPGVAKWLIGVMSVFYGISVFMGITPLGPFEPDQLTHPYSPWVSLLRIKGFVAALALIPLLQQGMHPPGNIRKYLVPGILTGLGLVAAVTLWERQIFTGLFNFSNDYRITASFFEMNTGGAFIDVYLAMCLPFVAACFVFWKNPLVKLVGLGLFVAGLYALLVTFSRICYASFLVSMIPLVLGGAVIYQKKWQTAALVMVLVVITAAITLPVLKGGYIKDRFSGLAASVDTRIKHWTDAVKKMDPDSLTLLFGMGQGTYPAAYFKHPDHVRPGIYEITEQSGDRFLRLYPGDSLYFGQLIDPVPDNAYTLTFEARTSRPGSGLTFPICEKSILYSFNCRWHTIKITAEGPNREPYQIRYDNLNIGQGRFYQARPVNFAIYNGSGRAVFEIDNVQLMDEQGNNLIKNGDFSKGNHFWFFATDNHLPWHIKNLWLSRFFDTGLLGLLGFFVFVLYTLAMLTKSIAGKDLLSLILFSSFCGFFTVGLIDSPFDSPRITFFFYFLSMVSLLHAGSRQQQMTHTSA